MKKLTVVVTTWNNQEKIARCLASVKWADEIIVVDSSSTDKTREVAERFTTKIFTQPNYPMLNRNKNFGFAKAAGQWVLSLDSDEEVTPALAREIQAILRSGSQFAGYWIARKNIIFGKWIRHGLWWPDKQLRLFRRGLGSFPCKHVHEYLTVDGPTAELNEPYLHHNYQSISQFISKMDTIYTASEVESLSSTNYQLSWYDALRFPVSDFLKVYFAQAGYRDGLHGLVLALLQAFYSLTVFAKLWERQAFPEREVTLGSVGRELVKAEKDLKYWYLSGKLHSETVWYKRLWWKLLRRYV